MHYNENSLNILVPKQNIISSMPAQVAISSENILSICMSIYPIPMKKIKMEMSQNAIFVFQFLI